MIAKSFTTSVVLVALCLPGVAVAQDAAATLAQAQRDWRQLNTASAIRGFERLSSDPRLAADAHLALGRIRAFRGWQAEGAFPGWHEEVDQRSLALAAYRRAAELRPAWAAPHVAIGEALLLDGRPAEALAAFDRALALTPRDVAASRGRQRATGATPADPEVDAVTQIDATIKAGELRAVTAQARAFLARWPESPRAFDVYARWFAALQATADAPAADVESAIDGRLGLRPDPLAHAAAVNILVNRERFDRARQLAIAGLAAGERFISENEPSYKLGGKVQASRDRNRAQFADLLGWIALVQGDLATAEQKLDEAARFSNGNDFLNQCHRAELAQKRGDAETARERYYDALSLDAPPALGGVRRTAENALAAIYAKEGVSAADTTTNMSRELDRRREERRRALLSTAVGKALPSLPTTDIAGTPVSLVGQRGQVTLLNFFAAWCGACRQEMPLIQKAYERYQADPSVRFVLISLDDDPKRLERYLDERKFAMPVLRMTREQAAAALDVQDTPWTFYVDANGTIRYEVRGLEPHGDAVARISWYIEQLKADKSATPEP